MYNKVAGFFNQLFLTKLVLNDKFLTTHFVKVHRSGGIK